METAPTIQMPTVPAELIEKLLIKGDLSGMDQTQKVQYYRLFCERLGLDPLTQPFKLLNLQGKQILYCDRSGAQQLNKMYSVSHEVRSREVITDAGVYQVTARASLPNGRYTDSIGAVNIQGMKGEAYANAIMKAETKAKRRSTLDLLGLGILDETETDSIPGAVIEPLPTDTNELEALNAEYMELYNEYILMNEDEAKKMHPDKWPASKGGKSVNNYIRAIASIKIRINAELQKS